MNPLRRLGDMLKQRSGIALAPDQHYLLAGRLSPILEREGLRDLAELTSRLRPGSTLERDVVEAMTTNESLFFRDGKPFEALRQQVLPTLHAGRLPGMPLRIWSAAAAAGQEAYSVAMIATELATAMPHRRVEILGTDIARVPLRQAQQGLYSEFEIRRGLPAALLTEHFDREGAEWRIKVALRQMVTFREWNLLADLTPLGRFDVILCRNVLIYFDTATKRRVLDGIARQLALDGALVLGGAETLLGVSDAFQEMAGWPGIYRRAGP